MGGAGGRRWAEVARVLTHPPYLIRTERLVIRCWSPEDAPLAKAAIDSSLDHLRLWMPWAHAEPTTVEEKAELFRFFRDSFDRGEDFVYGILDPDGSEVIGGTGLHTRVGPGAFEIGYWIRRARGRRRPRDRVDGRSDAGRVRALRR